MSFPFSLLKRRHEKAVEQFRESQTVAFEQRAKELLKRIRKELPQIHRLANCNGDFWLMGKDFDKVYEVEYIVGEDRACDELPLGTIYKDNVKFLLEHFDDMMDKPNVSASTYKALKELHDLAMYCECDTRVHTTTSIDVEA